MKVRHLVLPMAGEGKRLRPLTLRRPKPLVLANGKPLVHYVLSEAKGSGIKEVVFVVSPHHKGHFERYLKTAKKVFPEFTFHLRLQNDLYGDGHAVLHAYDVVKGKPFAVRFSDDLLFHKEPQLHALIDLYESKAAAPIMLLERVPKRMVSNYGVVGGNVAGEHRGGLIHKLSAFVEKPPVKEAPSNLTVVGGYVLTPRFMADLKRVFDGLKTPAKDSLRLAHAFDKEIKKGGSVYGWEFPGTRLDCGTLEGFAKAEAFLKKKGI